MSEILHEQIRANGIDLHVASCGPEDGPPMVLCHGFPELWYSWRHQLGALADAGYRAYAPDLRGYGDSAHPTEVADHRLDDRGRRYRAGQALQDPGEAFGFGPPAGIQPDDGLPMEPGCCRNDRNEPNDDRAKGMGVARQDDQDRDAGEEPE